MRILSTSYTNTPDFNDPEQWLDRISFYTGILEELSKQHGVESIEQINHSGRLESKGVVYHFLNYKKKRLYFPVALHRFIKKLDPDVVLVNGLIFPLQIIQLKLVLRSAVKIIVLHRGERPYRGIKGFLQKVADKKVNAYLFTAAGFGKEWTAHGHISDQHKIHEVIQASSAFHPVERNTARSALGMQGSPAFLWVGRLDANKDPLTVVKAFIQFLKFQPAARLYMIYQTEFLLQEVRDTIGSDKETAAAIRLVGKIPHAELQTWYSAADFIISGSHHEGSGIAVCEAMSCGCIPVLTDIISFRKMTGPGKCGFLYEPANDHALVQVLMQIPQLDLAKERDKALQQFKAELSFEVVAKKIEQVIASLP